MTHAKFKRMSFMYINTIRMNIVDQIPVVSFQSFVSCGGFDLICSNYNWRTDLFVLKWWTGDWSFKKNLQFPAWTTYLISLTLLAHNVMKEMLTIFIYRKSNNTNFQTSYKSQDKNNIFNTNCLHLGFSVNSSVICFP